MDKTQQITLPKLVGDWCRKQKHLVIMLKNHDGIVIGYHNKKEGTTNAIAAVGNPKYVYIPTFYALDPIIHIEAVCPSFFRDLKKALNIMINHDRKCRNGRFGALGANSYYKRKCCHVPQLRKLAAVRFLGIGSS